MAPEAAPEETGSTCASHGRGWQVDVLLARLRRTFAFMRGNLLVLTLTRSSGMFARTMTFPYASLYILALGGNPEQVGLINSLSPLASLIVFPIGGYLADHRGRVGLLGWTSIAMGLVYGLYAVAPSWPWLLVCSLPTRPSPPIRFPRPIAGAASLCPISCPAHRPW